jgi:hypothetical protein
MQEENTHTTSFSPEESEITAIRKDFPLTEYESLRDEITTRLELRQQMFTFVLIVAGTFLSLGFQSLALSMASLVYPVIGVFLAAYFEHNDEKIGSLSAYLRRFEEKYQLQGWETYRQGKRQKKKGEIPPFSTVLRSFSFPVIGLFISSSLGSLSFSARGLFLTTQVLSLAIGGVHVVQAGQLLVALPLLVCSILATSATVIVIQHSRS